MSARQDTEVRLVDPTGVLAGGSCRLMHSLADAHVAAFPDFFLSALGRPFLREYYRTILLYDGGLVVIAGPEAKATGFAAGFLEPARFYARLRRRAVHFTWPLLIAMARRPSLLARAAGGLRRARRQARSKIGGALECELASLAVVPGAAGQGLGGALLRSFCETARARGAQSVVLSTDAQNNERVRRFYERYGFESAGEERRSRDRVMQLYRLDFGRLP